MIDEKSLINKLNIVKNGFINKDKLDSVKLAYVIEKIIELLKSEPKVGEWIPVEDRLPEDNQTVLTCKNKQISILIWKAEKRRWLEPKGNWWWSYCMVEKWQPLSEPYEEKEDD